MLCFFLVGVTGFEHAKALGEGGEESIKSKALAPPLRSRVTAVIAAKRSPGAFCPTSRFGTPLPPVRVLHTENKKQDGGCHPAFYGRGDGIRTRDLYVPNVALYQTEPHPDKKLFNCTKDTALTRSG